MPTSHSYRRALDLLLGVVLAACALGTTAAPYTLSVHNGTGSGVYEEGTLVDVWANPQEDPTPDMPTAEPLDASLPLRIFDRWSGDTAYVEDIHSPQTKVLMPGGDILITAQYKDAPRWIPTAAITYFPAGYEGVIFMFHGGTSCAQCMLDRVETRVFVREATSRGFAIVALDSYDRYERKWDSNPIATENVDMRRVAALRNQLIAEGKMSAQDPVYVVGVSGGGVFASLWTQEAQDTLGFPIDAAGFFISPGNLDSMAHFTVPTIFAAAANDEVFSPSAPLTAYNYLLMNGVPTQILIAEPTPLYPARFWRIDGLDLDDSQLIYQSFVDAGVLDAAGYLLLHPSELDSSAIVPPDYQGQIFAIEQQLLATHAAHAFPSQFSQQVLDFLESPTTVVDLPPVVTGFSPPSGPPGSTVTVTGESFVDLVSVEVNAVPASYVYVSAAELRLVVPAGATPGPITITNSVGSSSSIDDFIVEPPSIAALDPATGRAGSLISITGAGLVEVAEVAFNGVSASFTPVTPTSVLATVPESALTGPVTVTNYLGTATSPGDFVVPPPTIASIDPPAGHAGSSVTITGAEMVNVSAVHFNGEPAAGFTSLGAGTLLATVPELASTGPVTVENPQGIAISPEDFVVNPPSISGLSPASGHAGDTVTISGAAMANITGVYFNGVPAAGYTSFGAGTLAAVVPYEATTGPVTVENLQGIGTSLEDFVIEPPEITELSPSSAPAGDTITITGKGMVEVTAVHFGAEPAAGFTSVGPGTVRATVPDLVATGPVTVENAFGAGVSPMDFTVSPPQIDDFSPPSGPAGTNVTVSGQDMVNVTAVYFNGEPASFTPIGRSTLVATVPAAAMTGPITVANAQGSGTSTDDFVLSPPEIHSFDPTGVPGDTLSINGDHFVNVETITFNGVAAETFSYGIGANAKSLLKVVIPALATAGPIAVVNPQGTAVSATDFIPSAPEIHSLDPEAGAVGATVTINGASFVNIDAVTFNGIPATFEHGLLGNARILIRAVVPAGATTGPVAISNPQGTALSPVDFTVVEPPVVGGLSATSGFPGDTLVITGEHLALTSSVTFCGTQADFTVDGDLQVSAVVPTRDPGFCQVVVTTPGGSASGGMFRIK